jgi:hypothetical protein
MRLEVGYRIQDTGYRIQDTGYRIRDAGYGIREIFPGWIFRILYSVSVIFFCCNFVLEMTPL